MATAEAGTEGGEDQMVKSSAQWEQLMEEDRDAGRLLMHSEKRTDPCRTP